MKKVLTCPAGNHVKEWLQKEGESLFYCGGRGTCGKCKGKILEGDAGSFTLEEEKLLTEEEKKNGVRLLCQVLAVTDLTFVVETEETAFWEKEEKHFGTNVFLEQEHINSLKTEKTFGAAFDIGTTTVVGKLFDLEKQQPIAEMTAWNPQGCFGADVISRMNYCLEHPNGKKEMQDKILTCINEMLKNFWNKAETKTETVVVAGNSAMTHFLLGENTDTLARVPFLPAFTKGQVRRAKDYGLLVKNDAKLMTLPLLQGQVGGDITGALLSIDIFSQEDGTLLADIGTNGEIAYFSAGTIYVCSTAAGPALEGAGISCGMRAQKGAIEKVWLTGGNVYMKVIGNTDPKGICGSALIDAIAVLLDLGKIQENGYLENGSVRLSKKGFLSDGEKISEEEEEIRITQEDIRQYQMVKAAIRAGMETVVYAAGKTKDDISKMYIAGAFGSNIRKQNAIKTGLLPNLPTEKINVIGNASLAGASMVLCSKEANEYAERIRERVVLVNLAENEEFQKMYIREMDFR